MLAPEAFDDPHLYTTLWQALETRLVQARPQRVRG